MPSGGDSLGTIQALASSCRQSNRWLQLWHFFFTDSYPLDERNLHLVVTMNVLCS